MSLPLLRLASVVLIVAGGCSQARVLTDAELVSAASGTTNRKARSELPPSTAARVCRKTAEELETHGKEAPAIEQYERSRRHDPSQKGIAHRLAVLYDRSGNHERASAEYAVAIKESPKSADVWSDFGYFEYERGRFDAAEKALRTALKHDERHERAWVNLGLVLAEKEQYEESFAAFRKAVSEAAANNNLGIVLLRQGKTDEARARLSRAIELDATLMSAKEILAYIEQQSDAGTARALPRTDGRNPEAGQVSLSDHAPRQKTSEALQ